MNQRVLHDDDDVDEVPLWRRPVVRVIALGVVAVVAFVFWRGTPEPKEPAETKPSQAFIGEVTPYTPAVAVAQPAAPPPPAKPEAPPAALAPPVAPAAPVFPFPTRMVPAAAPAAAKVTRPAMLSYAAAPPGPAAPAAAGSPPQPEQTRVAFKGGTIPGAKASAAVDETYMLMPGLLPCVLDTAIDSTLPGPIACHLAGPVYSTKGVLLMEAETRVIGRYEAIGKNGQNRLQAISTFAHTPHGIWVPLTDPMADDLGRSGLDGTVDRHIFERFGGAVLLTLTQSALGIVQSEVSKGGNTYLSFSSGGGVGGLAEQILQAQINIAPTFSKYQGETIAIWLTQPIDFSDSYKIRVAK
jgi:type IV secretion system protein VirB10